MKKKSPIGIGKLLAYVKSRLGYGARQGVSGFGLACKALAKDGRNKPPGFNDKAWVYENAGFIRSLNIPGRYSSNTTKAPKRAGSARHQGPARGEEYAGDVNSEDFLRSYEWRSLRVKVLMRYGRRCMCCGATPEGGSVMHVDHIKPRRLFPKLALTEDNLQVLCEDCNHGKGNWLHQDFRPEVEHVDQDVLSIIRSIARG